MRIKKRDEDEETERIRLIKLSSEEAIRLRQELNELKEQEAIRITKIRQLEEEEALRVAALAEEEANAMLARLKAVEEEEAERRKQKRIKRLEQELYQEKLKNMKRAEIEAEKLKQSHFNMINSKRMYSYTLEYNEDNMIEDLNMESTTLPEDDFETLGINEEELDLQCDELFMSPPIEFKPKKNVEADVILARVIHELAITIPVVHIKESNYLFGSTKLNLVVKRDQIFVQRGGGSQQLSEYYLQNKRQLQRSLVIAMIKSGESLECVIESLIHNRKIKNTSATINREFSPAGGRYSTTSPRSGNVKAKLQNSLQRTSTRTRQQLNRGISGISHGEVSPAERKYREQKDKILGDLRRAMQ